MSSIVSRRPPPCWGRSASRRTCAGYQSGWGLQGPCPDARNYGASGGHERLPRRRLLGRSRGRQSQRSDRELLTLPWSATSKDSTRHRCPVQDHQLSRTPPSAKPRMWRGAARFGRLRLLADRGSVGGNRRLGKSGGRNCQSRGSRCARPHTVTDLFVRANRAARATGSLAMARTDQHRVPTSARRARRPPRGRP